MIENRVPGETALRHLLREGMRRHHSDHGFILVSSTQGVSSLSPLDVFRRGRQLDSTRFYWERPDEGLALVGVGAAHAVAIHDGEYLGAADRQWGRLLEGAVIDDDVEERQTTGPLLFGGFAFDPSRPKTPLWADFPRGLLILPRYLITRCGDTCRLTVNTVIGRGSDIESELDRLTHGLLRLCTGEESPSEDVDHQNLASPPRDLYPAQDWKEQVVRAREAIRRGEAEKIVLARAVQVHDGPRLRPTRVLDQLRRQSGSRCSLFALARGDSCFVGATPESLVRLHGRKVEVSSLAGTTGRGGTDEEDVRLGSALLGSTKDRAEHAVVIRTLERQLAPICADLQIPREPVLMRLPTVQHLYTPLSARLVMPQTVLALVERLHPTPAIGGFPREAAMSFIRQREQLDRGWYAGPIGWMNRQGEGEFAVAIRSALLQGDTATLFAGCGIMADSDAESEYQESQLKLRSMLSILAGSGVS